eukprot:6188052-Pleurochrysis_carterae.AAC.7
MTNLEYVKSRKRPHLAGERCWSAACARSIDLSERLDRTHTSTRHALTDHTQRARRNPTAYPAATDLST